MSYGRALGAVEPSNTPDFVGLWAATKKAMFDSFGTYTQNGVVVTIGGRAQPLLNFHEASQLITFWLGAADDVTNQAQKDGRSITPVLKARAGFANDAAGWTLDATTNWSVTINGITNQTPDTYFPQGTSGPAFMPLKLTDDLMQIIAAYVVDLSASVWASYNIETTYERMLSSSPSWLHPLLQAGWAAGWTVDRVKEQGGAALKDIVSAASWFAKYKTPVLLGAAGLLGYALYKKVSR